jgi:dTDP-4-amino-4,6-dideoxygalactose transaminase
MTNPPLTNRLADKRPEFLPFFSHSIGDEEIAEVVDTLRSPWITTGPKTKRFEQEFGRYVGAPAALALSSCTAALHVALKALGVGTGDEVITTPMTFAASVNVIEHVGARPVLVDVEPDTLNIDPSLIEAAVGAHTRAIIPVHYAGHPAELDPILEIGQQGGIAVIEDAAHALPAEYGGRRIGSGSNPAAFSFYATKNLATAEGGMLTGDPDLIERGSVLGLHGMSRNAWSRYGTGGSWFYEVLEPGFKYNMTDIQASLGLWQLAKLDAAQTRRREIVARYQEVFGASPALEVPVERPHVSHAWHLYVLRLRPEALRIGRDQFVEELAGRNIGTSVHFIPIHLHPYYRDRYGYRPDDFPIAFDGYQRMLTLPLHPRLTAADVEDVIAAVLDVVHVYAR